MPHATPGADSADARAPGLTAAQPDRTLQREMNLVGGGLFITGGLLILAVVPNADWPGMHRAWLYTFAAIAMSAGVGLQVVGRVRPLPKSALVALAVLGTLNISGTVAASGPEGSTAYGVLHVFVTAFSFYYFSDRTASLLAILSAVTFAVGLTAAGSPHAAPVWVVVTVTNVVAGAMLGRIGHKVRTLLDEQIVTSTRLREVDEMKTAFLRAVSHELRTPLTTVVVGVRTIRSRRADLDEATTQLLLDRTLANAERLERMLLDLLDMDRISRGAIEARLEATDLAALTRRTVAAIHADNVRVRVLDGPPVPAQVEPSKVERIVENLVANALRHTPAPGRIEISVLPTPEGALLQVDDEGAGIRDDLKLALFQPFRQGDEAANSPSPGTGIGLALVALFAGLHGGRAWVVDREGGGASFRVLFPTHELSAPELAYPTPELAG